MTTEETRCWCDHSEDRHPDRTGCVVWGCSCPRFESAYRIAEGAPTDEQSVEDARAFLKSALAESDADERDPEGGAGWDVDVDARTVLRLLDGAGVAPPAPSEERALHYGRDVRNGVHTDRPDGFTDSAWHRAAMADAGVSHNLPGRLYIVQCEWCPKAFAANTKAEAMDMFREHERVIQEGP